MIMKERGALLVGRGEGVVVEEWQEVEEILVMEWWNTMEMVAGMVGVDMVAGGEVVVEDGVIVVVEEVMVVDICHNSQVVITTMVAEHLLPRAVGEDEAGAGVVGVAGVSDRMAQPRQLSEP